jgi:DNA (cytosine-5)-methyltransferase 1
MRFFSVSKQYTFIDLFAGLGGFHLALKQLGCECVFASELKEDLRKLYKINFPETPIIEGDITKVKVEDVPEHDILCAGFPCQPFSQAGKRQGFNDEKERGNLFYNILDIVKARRPKYILLENVATLRNHDHGRTWETIHNELKAAKYIVADPAILSPHQFAIPQHRRRIYIVCVDSQQGTLDHFDFPKISTMGCDIKRIVDENDTEITPIKPETRHQLEVWQEFLDKTIANGDKIPRFPIWAMEFGANYEYEKIAPAYQTVKELKGKKGKLGATIKGNTIEECLNCLPVYSQTDKTKVFPKWKISYIKQNRAFYEKHKEWLDVWIEKIKPFDNSHQKFEWNCGPSARPVLYDNIIQFRASGIRVKLPTFSPALNLVGTQVPILPWVKLPKSVSSADKPQQGRYMTVKEAAKLQGMQDLVFGDDSFSLSTTRIFEALGNAVNVTIIKHIAKNLLKE